MTPRFTCGLAGVGAADAGWAGGKAAALGELARAGIRVPDGYVITAKAFGLAMDALDPSGADRGALGDLPAGDLAGIARTAAGMRARVKEAPLPPHSALVAGEVTPDSFTVSKVTGEITGRRVGTKLRVHSPGPNGPGISARPTPPALRGSPCLADDEARALAAAGRRVEEHFGAPQDIEWALLGGSGDPADRIVLLQSRPETVWAVRQRAPVATAAPRAVDHVLARFRKAP